MTGKVIGHRSRDQGMRFFGVGFGGCGLGSGIGRVFKSYFASVYFRKLTDYILGHVGHVKWSSGLSVSLWHMCMLYREDAPYRDTIAPKMSYSEQ